MKKRIATTIPTATIVERTIARRTNFKSLI